MARATKQPQSRTTARKSTKTRSPIASAQERRIQRIVAEALRDASFAGALIAALSPAAPALAAKVTGAEDLSDDDAATLATATVEDVAGDPPGGDDDVEAAAADSSGGDGNPQGGDTSANDDNGDDNANDGGTPNNLTLVIRPRILKGFTLRIGAVNWNRND